MNKPLKFLHHIRTDYVNVMCIHINNNLLFSYYRPVDIEYMGQTLKDTSDTSSSTKDMFKTKEERQSCSREIITQLTDLGIGLQHPAVRKLYQLLREYNLEGKRIKVSIPFPEANRRIVGLLATGRREETWINLKHEKF